MKLVRTRGWSALIIAGALLVARPASSQGNEHRAAEAPSHAIRLGREARDAFERRDYTDALEKFLAADAAAHSPVFTLHVARCLRALGRWVDARSTYLQITGEEPPSPAPLPFTMARSDAIRELAELEATLPRLSVRVEGADSRAIRATLDGRPIQLPLDALPIDPGRHTLVARAGERVQERTLELTEGAHPGLVLQFAEAPAPPPQTLPAVSPLDATKPRLENRASAPEKLGSTPTQAAARSINPWLLSAATLAGAGLVSGCITGTLAFFGKRNLDCPGGRCFGKEGAELERTERLADIATVSFIVAGTAAASALGIWVATRSTGSSNARVGVALGAGTVMVQGEL